MDSICIREAGPGDAEALLAYMKAIGGESDNLSYGAEGMALSVGQEAAFLERMRSDGRSVFFCAWKGGELVGTASLSGLPRRMAHRAELGLSVRRAEWNRGVGSLLLRHVVDYARAHGVEIINLEVRGDNRAAIHLYEKFGFQKTGTIPAFFKLGGEYVDFDLMYLDLRG